MNKDICALGW